MGIVWEAYHKGVPLLGVPEIPIEWINWHTLPETNSKRNSPGNGWLEDDRFFLGWPIFKGELLVSGRVTVQLLAKLFRFHVHVLFSCLRVHLPRKLSKSIKGIAPQHDIWDHVSCSILSVWQMMFAKCWVPNIHTKLNSLFWNDLKGTINSYLSTSLTSIRSKWRGNSPSTIFSRISWLWHLLKAAPISTNIPWRKTGERKQSWWWRVR